MVFRFRRFASNRCSFLECAVQNKCKYNFLNFQNQLAEKFLNFITVKFIKYRETYPEIPQTNPQPPQNIVVEASEGEDFDINLVQPQGTTKRPFEQVPSLSDLPTTTPLPSPLLQHQFINVPNSNQGIAL